MNKFIGIGNLVKDCTLETAANGTKYVRNAIAINTRYTDKEGNPVDNATFINFVVFGARAEYLGKNAKKGYKLAIDGTLNISSYVDKEGITRTGAEIMVDSMELLDSEVTASAKAGVRGTKKK